ncbi:hypothetical protein OG840_35975 [Streptomyces sp. NBC_01764]|uniref:hypothetical protein n=1 Tax=Streptomyces sp. NBC_01764 TaxID=2975935 RepID=UPI0022529E69|nr:hypothetical protein [Streptomyces sp. NBC_01764]MCX4406847.1 hypothetical protein [Streptomyces sp. NBC_01764]
MSAQAGGGVPAPRPSLYAYALRLYRSKPDGRPPHGGYPLPDPPPLRARPGRREAQAGVRDALAPLLSRPDTVRAADEIHRRLHTLDIRDLHIQAAMADLPLEDTAAARALGRHLTRTGTSTLTVNVGIALLARLGEPEDVPYLKVLGLLRVLARPAVDALTALHCPTAALVWLADHTENRALHRLIDAIAARDDHEARTWLINAPLHSGAVGPSTARRIAKAVRLADILREEQSDTQAIAQAGRLLSRMTGLRDYRPEILSYQQATTTYNAFVAGASQLPPTPDHYAILLSVALDLHSGPSVLLDWRSGQREALLRALEAVLSTQSWEAVAQSEPEEPAERRRVHWIRRTARQPFHHAAVSRFRVEATVRDPADADTVEVRLLIDGRPLVPEAFGKGAANSPEYLLDSGRLRAAAEPREVQLAEAYCTEGCCGALYVTIRREGDQVVWSDWRRPPTRQPQAELPEYRFDAADYDTEIERAENDRSWAWPARNTARSIAAGLRDQPDLLTRWDGQVGWIGTDFHDQDTTVVSFTYWPGLAAGQRDKDGPWLQFIWSLPDDGTPPENQAAAALRQLAEQDPKTYAQVRGGSRSHAEALGFPWPEPSDPEESA